MTSMINALIAASSGLSEDDRANLVLSFTEKLKGAPLALRERVAHGVAALLGIAVSTSPSVLAKGRAKSPIFIREVIEFDPSVFNGYSISKGAFINSLATYTGSHLLCVGSRGGGDKFLIFGQKRAGCKHAFTYPSGKAGVLEDFEHFKTCKSWPEAHAYLTSFGVPHGKAMPFGKAIGT